MQAAMTLLRRLIRDPLPESLSQTQPTYQEVLACPSAFSRANDDPPVAAWKTECGTGDVVRWGLDPQYNRWDKLKRPR